MQTMQHVLTAQNTRKPFGGRGSAPDPAEGAYSALANPLSGVERQPAPPHQIGVLRERCKLPQRGPGRSRRVFLYSEPGWLAVPYLRTPSPPLSALRASPLLPALQN